MAEAITRFTTEALVIKEMNVGESDRLVTLFSKEHGIIKAFASGAKGVKSKKGAATSLLTYGSFTIKNKNGSLRIYEATPIKMFFGAGDDIVVLTLAQYFCELSFNFAVNGTNNTEFLRLILNSLHFLTVAKRYPPLIKAITELRTATISGYAPNLIACDGCGKFEEDIMYFNTEDGIITCGECERKQNSIPIDRTMLSAMRHIVYSDFNKLYNFEIPNDRANLLSDLTSNYLVAQTDYRFKTLDFYNSIKE
ncbi:MAG: DNA repair protein RecO [Clostridia bacterium]|nr:DNA repair protein RecO [Clostridia bacterium]